jgi:hypothetical protein
MKFSDSGVLVRVKKCGTVEVINLNLKEGNRKFSSSDLDEVILEITSIIEEKKKELQCN